MKAQLEKRYSKLNKEYVKLELDTNPDYDRAEKIQNRMDEIQNEMADIANQLEKL